MSQWVQMLATKPENMSSVPEPAWWEERNNSPKLSCNCHICAMALHTHTHTRRQM